MAHFILAIPILAIAFIAYVLFTRHKDKQVLKDGKTNAIPAKPGVYSGLSSVDDLATQIGKIKKTPQFDEIEATLIALRIKRIEDFKNLYLPSLEEVEKNMDNYIVVHKSMEGKFQYRVTSYMALAVLNNTKKIFIRLQDFYPNTAKEEPLKCINSPLYLITTCLDADQDLKEIK